MRDISLMLKLLMIHKVLMLKLLLSVKGGVFFKLFVHFLYHWTRVVMTWHLELAVAWQTHAAIAYILMLLERVPSS